MVSLWGTHHYRLSSSILALEFWRIRFSLSVRPGEQGIHREQAAHGMPTQEIKPGRPVVLVDEGDQFLAEKFQGPVGPRRLRTSLLVGGGDIAVRFLDTLFYEISTAGFGRALLSAHEGEGLFGSSTSVSRTE
jgi:hypothetical protein